MKTLSSCPVTGIKIKLRRLPKWLKKKQKWLAGRKP
jgi:hypothetical protein